jgi:uncharacterized protein YndB with AHSA1/START domain
VDNGYGHLTEPATLTLQRLLPGPIERVWDYLTRSDLRRQWLASGEMGTSADAPMELVWRNDELTQPPGNKPSGFGDEHRMQSHVTIFEPPRKLAFGWGDTGNVLFELSPQGDQVLLTLTHSRLPDRNTTLMVGAGWHAHLDLLVARVSAVRPAPFWDRWVALRQDYEARLPT